MEEEEELISASEAARRIGVTSSTVLNWVQTGKLKGRRIGKSIVVSAREVEEVNKWSLGNESRQRYLKKK